MFIPWPLGECLLKPADRRVTSKTLRLLLSLQALLVCMKTSTCQQKHTKCSLWLWNCEKCNAHWKKQQLSFKVKLDPLKICPSSKIQPYFEGEPSFPVSGFFKLHYFLASSWSVIASWCLPWKLRGAETICNTITRSFLEQHLLCHQFHSVSSGDNQPIFP